MDLYREDNLSFSFELQAGELRKENGVLWVDKSELNNLIGMAVVSVPAYKSARALALVAEDKRDEYQRAMQNAAILATKEKLAEASLDTIMGWVYNAVYQFIGENVGYFPFSFLFIGVDSAALHNMETGKMYRVDYAIRESDVMITDFYEVELVRASDASIEHSGTDEDDMGESEVNEKMPNDVNEHTAEEVVEQPVEEVISEEAEEAVEEEETLEAEAGEEAAEEEAQEEPEEGSGQETETVDATEDKPEEDFEQKLAQQAERIAELERIEEQWKATEEAKAQAAEAQKREELMAGAEAAGLDVKSDEVKAAVEGADYAQLVSLIFEAALKRVTEKTDDKTPTNPMVADMRLKGEWLFEKN